MAKKPARWGKSIRSISARNQRQRRSRQDELEAIQAHIAVHGVNHIPPAEAAAPEGPQYLHKNHTVAFNLEQQLDGIDWSKERALLHERREGLTGRQGLR